MSDLISRQAVIDTIHRFFTEEVDKIPTKKTEDGEVYIMHKCQPLFEMNKEICKRIKALASASPTQNCVGNALDMRCDDAISRDMALEKMADYVASGYADSAEDFEEYSRIICQLPSVNPQEPKTGHWTHDGSHWKNRFVCSECGYKLFDEPTNYCPNCGARMFEPQESEE